jgi:DUF2934 family protein
MPKDPIKKQAANVITDQSLEEQIRLRAYELHEARGHEHGHDLDDWLRAEAEITGTAAKAA